MEFIVYTPDTVKGQRRGEPTIRLSRKAAISLSLAAVEAIGLKENDCIAIVQDVKNKEWYITTNPEGFKLRSNTAKTNLCFNCSELAKKVLDICNLPGKGYTMKVATQPTEIDGQEGKYFSILTSSAK